MFAGIIAILANLWPVILGIAAGLLLLYNRYLKRKIEGQRATIDRQENAIQTHETIHEIDKQDQQTDQQTEQEIDKVRDQMEGKPPEEQGEVIGDALDNYFESGKK